jgi:elongation factor G
MHANHHEERENMEAGEIGVWTGLKQVRTGDSLCHAEDSVLMEVIQFPEPVISMAVEPKVKGDSKKLEDALERMMEEDPTLKVSLNPETGQKLLSGMGELHLEVVRDRVLREYNLNVRVGNPQVAYRETVSRKAAAKVTVDRVMAGNRIFAGMTLELAPAPRGDGVVIDFDPAVSNLPKTIRSAVREALGMAASCGISGIYPLVDVRMRIIGAEYQESESSDSAFMIAASQAYEKALRQSDPVLLEPMMRLEIVTPEEFNGDVIGDLNARRGRILDLETRGPERIIISEVPLSTMFGYATVLRSLSRGRAAYTMEPFKFEVVPREVQEKILGWSKI